MFSSKEQPLPRPPKRPAVRLTSKEKEALVVGIAAVVSGFNVYTEIKRAGILGPKSRRDNVSYVITVTTKNAGRWNVFRRFKDFMSLRSMVSGDIFIFLWAEERGSGAFVHEYGFHWR